MEQSADSLIWGSISFTIDAHQPTHCAVVMLRSAAAVSRKSTGGAPEIHEVRLVEFEEAMMVLFLQMPQKLQEVVGNKSSH